MFSGGRRLLTASPPIVEAVIQVFAKVPGINGFFQLHVGGREHAQIDGDALARSQSHHFTLLQHPQQLDRDRHRQIADFIEEQGAPIGSSNQPALALGAPVNAPFS